MSGGCLERDVEKNAKEVLASGEPRLVIYDTRGDADMVFGTALGCGGLVEVFIERLPLQDERGPSRAGPPRRIGARRSSN